MRNIPFDGSKNINDTLMEKVEPFDYSEMVKYTSGYLPGYYAERYDDDLSEMSERISERFRIYIDEEEEKIRKHSDKNNKWSDNYYCKYALLPIWFLNYEYKGTRYTIVINGQTGKISGQVPTDTKKRKRKQILKVVWGISRILLVWLALILLIAFFSEVIVSNGSTSLIWSMKVLFSSFLKSFFLIPAIIIFLFWIGVSNPIEFIKKAAIGYFKLIEDEVYSIDEEITRMPPSSTYILPGDSMQIKEAERKESHSDEDDNM